MTRSDDSITSRLVIGLAFCAAGVLLVALAPHRKLTCAHAARAPVAAACMAHHPATADGEAPVARDDLLVATSDCPLPPDIQCRLEARIVGLIPSEDVRFAGIRDFELLENRVERRATSRARKKAGVDRTLVLAAADGAVDAGWHGKAFATPERHDRLLAFARKAGAARIELIDSPKLSIVAGFVMLALGAVTAFGAITARR